MGASAINSSKAAFIIRILVESLQHRADPRVTAIRRLLEAGFTGERTDKNGTKRFYRDGRQVANPTARERAAIRQGSRRALPAHQRISHDEAKRRIGAIGPDTPPEHIKALANDLMNMSYADLIRIKQDLGARGGWGSKQRMTDRLQQGVERNELPETKKQGLKAVRVKRGADGKGIEVDASGDSNRIAWQTPDGKLHSTAIGAYGHLKQNRHLVEPPKAKRIRKSRAGMTLLGIVAAAGGITPRSVKAMANYKEDVIQGGLLHGMRKQGTDISKMAEIMERAGHFRTPAGRHADDYLLELLAGREESLLAAEEHDYDKDQEEYHRAQQAAQEEGNDERSIETSRRRGEEAGEGEGYSEVSGWDQPGEEGTGREEEEYDRSEPAPGEVDSSFDFGANAREPEPEPPPRAEEPAQATPAATPPAPAAPQEKPKAEEPPRAKLKENPRDKIYEKLLKKGTPRQNASADSPGIIEIDDKHFTPEIRKALRSDRDQERGWNGGPEETDSFQLKNKNEVTGNPYDQGMILLDKRQSNLARQQAHLDALHAAGKTTASAAAEKKTTDESDIENKILRHLKYNPDATASELRQVGGHKSWDDTDPLANPVNAAIDRLEKRGKIKNSASGGKGGVPLFSAIEEPGFTGIDAEGREWRNGELVAAKDEPKAPDASSGEPPRNIPPSPNHLTGWDDYDPKEPPADNDWSEEEKGWHRESQQRIRAQWPALREQYISKMGRFDDEGNLAGLTLNTDEWRGHFEGYQGTNSHIFQDAASYANKRLLHEAFVLLKGKGNNTFLMLGGGAGSGKSSALELIVNGENFPVVFDTVASSHQYITQWLNLAAGHGFDRQFVFVDRNPRDAWKNGVVKRAMEDRKKFEAGDKSSLARTVPLDYAIRANLEAREAALKTLEKGNSPVLIANNLESGLLQRIEKNAKEHLSKQVLLYNKDTLFKELFDETRRLYESGEIPGDLARGFIGHLAGTDGQNQLRHAQKDHQDGRKPERPPETGLGGVPDQSPLDTENAGAGVGPGEGASGSRQEDPGQDSVTPSSAVHSWARKQFKNPEHARNFTNWFGDSKVTNDQGEPLVVYHGGLNSFAEFSDRLNNSNLRKSFFFAEDPWDTHRHSQPQPGRTGGQTYAVYLNIKNPMVVTDSMALGEPEEEFNLLKDARDKGHDGIVFKTSGKDINGDTPASTFVAFRPTQIKSALGNRGTFDPSSPKITEAVMPANHAAKVKLVQDIITRMGAKPPQAKQTREAEPCGDPRVKRIRELLAGKC